MNCDSALEGLGRYLSRQLRAQLVASSSIQVGAAVVTSVIAASRNVSLMPAVIATVVTPTILGESRLKRVSCAHSTPRCSFVARAGEDGNTHQQRGQHYCYQGSFHLQVPL